MQHLFEEVGSLDRRCYERFHLTEDLLMEHAADGIADTINSRFEAGNSILIVCGPGNNGADGIALGRLLHENHDVRLLLPYGAKSPMCLLQLKRAEAIGVALTDAVEESDLIVDALFGTGFSGAFDADSAALMQRLNGLSAFKVACDIPSGLHSDGTLEAETFRADATVTMGALKRGMFSDAAKARVGTITVVDLGVAREIYETESDWLLLDPEDLTLPFRDRPDSHKGSYGHLGVICGEKEGAAVMAGGAALRFGAGLVTLLSNERIQIPCELMQSHTLPPTATAITAGMGLGQEFSENELHALLDNDLPLVIDADLFAHPMLPELLRRREIVLTPHPREFALLLNRCGIAEVDAAEVQRDRFRYVEAFAAAFPDAVLLLKGANVIIAAEGQFYINPHGSNVLAKGGSGDVLAGMAGALLAQGFTARDAAIHASLAHTAAAAAFEGNNYALTPPDLIACLGSL
jgi:hydroxyethylthiazole kinase-like uncharacterized protein yjeF